MKYLISAVAVLILGLSVSGQQITSPDPGSEARAKSGMTSITGQVFGSAELNGKIVVLNFWFTNCPPCLKEIPELNELVEEYKDKDVVFLALAVDDKPELVEFIKKKPFHYDIIPSATALMFRYLTPDEDGRMETEFPTHIVIGRTGEKLVYETGLKGIAAVRAELEKQFMPAEETQDCETEN